MSLQEEIKGFLAKQLLAWDLAAKNVKALEQLQFKTISFNGFSFILQFNPARIRSSAAKLDAASIQKRMCFLCTENRPVEQQAIRFKNYWVLVNPFPIFPEHYTIADTSHCLQTIAGRMDDMLELATELSTCTVFYNGPSCGASAPDHFHFQAGKKDIMPVDTQLPSLKQHYGRQVTSSGVTAWSISDKTRNFFVLESTQQAALVAAFELLYQHMDDSTTQVPEPAMNLLARFDKGLWRLLVFPRQKQRPWQFFETGDKHIMISPASVEMGGLLVMPLLENFDNLSVADIKSVMQQVSISTKDFQQLSQSFFDAL